MIDRPEPHRRCLARKDSRTSAPGQPFRWRRPETYRTVSRVEVIHDSEKCKSHPAFFLSDCTHLRKRFVRETWVEGNYRATCNWYSKRKFFHIGYRITAPKLFVKTLIRVSGSYGSHCCNEVQRRKVQVYLRYNGVWDESTDTYVQMARDYRLLNEKMLQFLQKLLSKNALRFYLAVAVPNASAFHQNAKMIDLKFNFPVRKARAKNYLEDLRNSVFTAATMEASEALSKGIGPNYTACQIFSVK